MDAAARWVFKEMGMTGLLRLTCWLVVFGCTGLELFAQDAAKKLPAPDAAAKGKAVTEIRDLFKDEYAKKKPADRHALAVKLSATAKSTRDDPAVRFVLLSEAQNLAAKTGDVSLAMEVVDEIARSYDVSQSAMKLAALEAAAGVQAVFPGSKGVGDAALEAVDGAVADDDMESAGRLLKLAEAAARKSKNGPLVASVLARGKEVATVRQESEKVKAAVAKLEKDPADAAASVVYGKYLCLLVGDWGSGLPLLAAGNDAKLRAVAKQEGRKPTDAAEQVDLGEAWMELAAAQAEPYKGPMTMRAYHWFLLARPKLPALKKVKVDQWMVLAPRRRLTEMEEVEVKAAGPWGLGKGVLRDEIPIAVNGNRSPTSLSVHPNDGSTFVVKYRLAKVAKTFKGGVGLNDTCLPGGASSPVTFKVLGDGKPLWTSSPVRTGRELQMFHVNVAGVDVLELRAECPGGAAGAHAIWWEPQVMR